jgi:hypothetical protein
VKRPGRDVWLVAGLLAVLAVVSVLAAARQTQQSTPPPLASFSNAPDGARALRLWLEDLGYTVRDDSLEPFDVPEHASLAFMLEPTIAVAPEEWRVLDHWVESGGTLVLAGDALGTAFATEHYTITLSYLTATATSLSAQMPLFASPPLGRPPAVRAQAYLATTRRDVTPLLGAGADLVALSFTQGKGRVIVSAAPFAFTNAGLKEPGNPELVLNLASADAKGAGLVATGAGAKAAGVFGANTSGLAWFDEWHHGVQPNAAATIGGPEDWLRFTPAGHALLFVAATIFLALLLGGGRFGRPVPLARDTLRRAPLEYITAMANLHRRAGPRRAALRHYHEQLKRRLGRRYRLDPALRDPEYAARLAGLRPGLDADTLRTLLKGLAQPAPSEEALVRLAGQAADWMKEIP